MNVIELRDEVIRRGLESVEKTYVEAKDAHKLKGSQKGFEICKTLTMPADFESEIKKHEERCSQMRMVSDPTPKQLDQYWEQRYLLLQIEFVFERMKVVWKYPTVSAHAVLQVAEIVDGIKHDG